MTLYRGTLASMSYSVWLLSEQIKGNIFNADQGNSGDTMDVFGVALEFTKSANSKNPSLTVYSNVPASNLTDKSDHLISGN